MDQEWDKSGKHGYLGPQRWGQSRGRIHADTDLQVHFKCQIVTIFREKTIPFAVVHFHILRSLASDVSYQAQSLVTMKGCRKVRLPSASKSANERSATEQSELFLRGKVIVQIMGLIRSDQWLASNFHVPPPPPHLSRRHQSLSSDWLLGNHPRVRYSEDMTGSHSKEIIQSQWSRNQGVLISYFVSYVLGFKDQFWSRGRIFFYQIHPTFLP